MRRAKIVCTLGPSTSSEISEKHVGTDGTHRDESTMLRLDGAAHR